MPYPPVPMMPPLALNCSLNLLAPGATGPTRDQSLEFLQYENVADAKGESSPMVWLATVVNGEYSNQDQTSSIENQLFLAESPREKNTEDAVSRDQQKRQRLNSATENQLVIHRFAGIDGSESRKGKGRNCLLLVGFVSL